MQSYPAMLRPTDVNEFLFLHSCLRSMKPLSPHTSSHCQVFHAAAALMPEAYTHTYKNTNRICVAAFQTSAPPPLGFSQPVVYFLPVYVCLCQSVLFRLALGGQPFSISNDVPRKSVSRATGIPNTLPVASSLWVFYLHF